MPLLEDKVAIVTGAGRGIGRGVAKLMAAEGAKVVVCDLGVNVDGSGADISVAQQVVNEIGEAGGTAVACTESVATMDGGEKIVQTAVDNFGKLDIVVTVAGILRDRMVFNMTEEEWDDVIAVHLKGTFTVVKHASILFRQQRVGPDHHVQQHFRAVRKQRAGELRRGQGRHRRVHAGLRAGPGTVRRDGERDFAVGEHADDDERAGRGAGVAVGARASRRAAGCAARLRTSLRW